MANALQANSLSQAVIFAGGLGTRFAEETQDKPKPMIKIGPMPILWHIMKIYHHQGVKNFVICAGYRQEVIKEFFINYRSLKSDIEIDFSKDSVTYIKQKSEDWKITIVDTGMYSQTAYRLKMVQDYLEDEFYLTYGDGVANIDLNQLDEAHCNNPSLVTLTAVQPKGRFGALNFQHDGYVSEFKEKPIGDGHWVNGGFFRVNKMLFSSLPEIQPETSFEECLEQLSKSGTVFAYKHRKFWAPMDTLRDYKVLNAMYDRGDAPWKIWNE